MKDLTVEIPKKYKKALTERFSLKNAKKDVNVWTIKRECPLCRKYGEVFCYGCPFRKFAKPISVINNTTIGCILWMRRLNKLSAIFMHNYYIMWSINNNKTARKQLKLLKKKARKLIKWV